MKASRRIAWAGVFALVCACAVSLVLGLAVTAQAAPETIAAPGSGAGKVQLPAGVAIDSASGDLYVADRGNFRIDRFDSEGTFLLAWGWGVADGKGQEVQSCGPGAEPPTIRCFEAARDGGGPGAPVAQGPGAVAPNGIALDPASGDVFVTDSFYSRLSKFTPTGEFLFMVGKEVNKTDETNLCTAADVESGDICGKGESGSGESQEFESPRALAFDPAGNLWVGDTSRLVQLDPSGNYLCQAAIPGGGATKSLAIDSEGYFYLKSASLPGARKYAPSGGPCVTLSLAQVFDEAGSVEALALDGEGNVWTGECERISTFECPAPYRFKAFEPGGEQVSQFGAGQVLGEPGVLSGNGGNPLAIDDARGALYSVSNRSAANSFVQRFDLPEPGPLPEDVRAEDILPTSATLAASLNPEGEETKYHFEYLTEQAYQEQEESFEGLATEKTPEQTLPGSEYDSEALAAEIEGLIPETEYRFRLVASNHCDPEDEEKVCTVTEQATFTTRPAVAIEAQWAGDVAAQSAALRAELDPLGAQAASWWVEYGTSPCSEGGCAQSAPAALPGSFGVITVGAALSGLDPATTYFYRFAAEGDQDGETYEVAGPDRSFTTQLAALGFTLPDSRVWEMVTPPDKFGGRVGAPFDGQGLVQAAAGGEGLAFNTAGSIEAEPEGNRAPEDSSVLARRGSGGQWSAKDITPPHTTATPFPAGKGFEYKLFSPELDSALLEPRDTTPLSPFATERTPYLRDNAEPPEYTPLLSGAEGYADVPAGTEFGGDPEDPLGKVSVAGASLDLGHVALRTEGVALAEGAPGVALYLWSASDPPEERLAAVSVLPESEGGAVGEAELGSAGRSVRNAVSADGSRVFWSRGIEKPPFTGLYVRDTERAETARLDVVQPGAFGTGAVNPIFQGASADGTVAFFTDTHNLTEDASENGADLYRCEVTIEEGELGCELSDLTPNGQEGAEVLGLAAGISEDGTRVYFAARGALAEGASPGQPNLYLWEQGEDVRFLATLSEEDFPDWGLTKPGGSEFLAAARSAAASPSGRYLAFMSQRSLTGYDNRDATSGEPAQEVFRYDAEANGGEGELICASCNPSGRRPAALLPGEDLALEFDPQNLWGDIPGVLNARPVAAVLPEATKRSRVGASLYRPRAVHDNGRLFFNAADSLVAADSNGDGDVYQYEPLGRGGCSPASAGPATALSAGGCVSLISSGTAAGTAAFIDADVGGDNVFFYSPARLSVTDEDDVTDIYDARVNGTAATLEPRAECLGEACQPPAPSPPEETPASAVFEGPGNQAAPAPCGALSERVRKLSRRAKALRRSARRIARRPAKRQRARRVGRKANRLSRRAKGMAKRARRCRRTTQRSSR